MPKDWNGWLMRLRAKKNKRPVITDAGGGRYGVTWPDGTIGTIDEMTKDFLESSAPAPRQSQLEELFERCSEVRVLEGGMWLGKPLKGEVLATLTGAQLAELRRRLHVVDGGSFHCMCVGTHVLEFRAQYEKALALIGLHHGISIRWDAWSSDATLRDGRGLAEWLATVGVAGPLAELVEADESRREQELVEKDWLSCLPECLSDLTADFLRCSTSGMNDSAMAAKAAERLHQLYPDEAERVGLLLHWFGAGTGKCSGYPVHEGIPGQILETERPPAIIEFLTTRHPTERHFAGGLRFFAGAGWRSADLVPAEIQQSLLDTAIEHGDADNLKRARKVFTKAAASDVVRPSDDNPISLA